MKRLRPGEMVQIKTVEELLGVVNEESAMDIEIYKIRSFQLILEVVVSESNSILVASERYPAALVKSKLLKLNYSHIEYVLECLNKNTTKVQNIKKYLLAALFNAPSTMNGYYQAEVNHDMPQFAVNH